MESNSLESFSHSTDFVNQISTLYSMRRNLRDAQIHILLSFDRNYDSVLIHIMNLMHIIDEFIELLLTLRPDVLRS